MSSNYKASHDLDTRLSPEIYAVHLLNAIFHRKSSSYFLKASFNAASRSPSIFCTEARSSIRLIQASRLGNSFSMSGLSPLFRISESASLVQDMKGMTEDDESC